jgi:hypothetical protein
MHIKNERAGIIPTMVAKIMGSQNYGVAKLWGRARSHRTMGSGLAQACRDMRQNGAPWRPVETWHMIAAKANIETGTTGWLPPAQSASTKTQTQQREKPS